MPPRTKPETIAKITGNLDQYGSTFLRLEKDDTKRRETWVIFRCKCGNETGTDKATGYRVSQITNPKTVISGCKICQATNGEAY